MSSFPSTVPAGLTPYLTARFQVAHSVNLDGPLVRMEDAEPALDPLAPFGRTMVPMTFVATPGPPVDSFPSVQPASIGDHWFEIIHVLPRRIDLGNILTVINRTIDIYNASITEPHDLEQFINNAGAGTSILDLPPLPYTIQPQESLLLTLEVTPEGAPTIDATLDFDTDEPYLLSVPITGTRIVMFPFEPEAPMTERLLFLTDALEAIDGTEQRVSLRLAPRQEFDLRLLREDGPERQKLDFLLFDWSSRVFGLPVWIEPSFVTANITAGQTSVSVDDTTLADFRADGLGIIYENEDKFDALEILSIGPTTINFKTPIQNSYSAANGIRVMPLRTAIVSDSVREKKYAMNLAEFSLRMRVLDNDVDLSSTSGWPTYNSKVLLSDPNAIDTTLDGQIERRVELFDSGTGKFAQSSTWSRARHGSAKTFIIRTRANLWSIRKLLHALRGRQVSFYLPTFTKDVSLAVTYTSGSAALTIFNVGYTKYARQRTPKVDIRIVLKSGTIFTRTITNSSEIDATQEQLTLSATIGQTITAAEIERIEFLEKVRIDTEEITIEHRSANGEATIAFPVKGVLE